MPVFLSHKREDKDNALQIATYLTSRRVICYIDAFDPTLQSTDDITATLMRRLRECTHLMAVVSDYTEKSWWVPFEVGVASQLDRRITSYRLSNITLPQFLSKWPILKKQADLERFVEYYLHDQPLKLAEARASSPRFSSAEQFHRALKGALGQ